jgi:propionyl-CoA synthetase
MVAVGPAPPQPVFPRPWQDEPVTDADAAEDWLDRARQVSWISRPRELGQDPLWFPGASLNTCYNALDRHVVRGHGDATALVVEAAGDRSAHTFAELLERTAAFAGALRGFGVRPGDRVVVHLPASAEAVVAMLACARIGGVHAVVAPDIDAEALARTLGDLRPTVVVTTAAGEPRPVLHRALALTSHHPQAVVVHRRHAPRAASEVPLDEPLEADWAATLRAGATDPAGSLEVGAADPLCVLTHADEAGTVRGNGAHAVAAAWVAARVLEGQSASVWWATSPLPTGAGQLLSLYAPLISGVTTLVQETGGGAPTVDALWSTVRRNGVDVLLTTAEAVQSWRHGDTGPSGARRLQALAVVDAPLDPGTRDWAREHLAERVLDTVPDADDPFLAPYGVSGLASATSRRSR